MEYSKEEFDFVKSWLDRCVKIEHKNSIYYITSSNIIRQLKYNRLLNKKNIKINLTNLIYNDSVILWQDLNNKIFYVNDNKIWNYFDILYGYYPKGVSKIINNIVSDILKTQGYSSIFSIASSKLKLSEVFNLNEYIIKIK